MHRIHADFEYDDTATTVTSTIAHVLEARAGVCQDFKYMGLQWVDQCWCSNEYGHHGSAAGCGATGSTCGRGYRNAPTAHTSQCGNMNAVYRTRRNP